MTTLIAQMHEIDNNLEAATEALLVASQALLAWRLARSLAGVDDITLPQFRALVVLTRPVSVTVGDQAVALDNHPSTATRLCDRLEKRAWFAASGHFGRSAGVDPFSRADSAVSDMPVPHE